MKLSSLMPIISFGVVFIRLLILKSFPVHERGIVLMTGASSGIGRDAAIALVKAGYTVMAGVRDEKYIHSFDKANMANLIPIHLNVVNGESLIKAFEQAEELVKEIELPFVGIVNVAGVYGLNPMEFTTEKDLQYFLNINTIAPFKITNLFTPLLKKHAGRVVNIGAAEVNSLPPLHAAYVGAKGALSAMTHISRRELAPFKVSVSLIRAGHVRTPQAEGKEKIQLLSERISSDAWRNYQNATASTVAYMEEALKKAPTPGDSTTPKIIHALTSKNPAAEYLCGGSSWPYLPLMVTDFLFWLLPPRLEDVLYKTLNG